MAYRIVELVELIYPTDEINKGFSNELEALAKKHGVELGYTDEYYRNTPLPKPEVIIAEDVQARSEP